MNRILFRATAVACLLSGLSTLGQAQVPGNNFFSYSRASAFTYRADGLLQTETVEPDYPDLCVTTTYGYDEYGNKTTASTANCAGASATAQFTPRSSSTDYKVGQTVSVPGGTLTIPLGTVPGSATNALGQTETKIFDPRFGAVTNLTGPNGIPTAWQADAFGRPVLETRADGTSTVIAYCLLSGKGLADLSSNSSECAGLVYASGEVPTDAVSVVHTEPRTNANTTKNGPFSRVYMNRAGQKIRSVTEAFDGGTQPGGASRLIVQDVDYNAYGVQTVSTQPYFLDTGSSVASGSTHYGMTYTEVDVLGRTTKVYSTDANAMPAQTRGNQGGNQASIAFGSRGSYQASLTQVSYGVLTVTTVNDKGQTRLEEKNIDGKLARVTDALGAQLAHQYDAFGNLLTTRDALQNRVDLLYDIRGRKTQLSDPDTGIWTYAYNALGQMVAQQNPNQRLAGNQTSMAYDVLGRMSSRTEIEYVSTWYYDKYADGTPCGKGVGKLCESTTSNGVRKRINYDTLGRPQNSRTDITSGPSFGTAVTYDAASGRPDTQTYPSGLTVKLNYTAKGYLLSLNTVTAVTVNPMPATPGGAAASSRTYAAGAALWTAQAANAWGQSENSLLGNGLSALATFDPMTGRVIRHTVGAGAATNVQDYNYVWDSLARVATRSDANGDGSTGAVTDNFSYDAIGRLAAYTVASSQIPGLSRTVTLRYNALGMTTYKSDVGTYTYPAQGAGAVRPHALQSVAGTINASYGYDANGNLNSASAGQYRSLIHTSFNLPDSQTGVQGPSGSPRYTWQYDENHQRIKETRWVSAGANAGTRTTWMLHPDNVGGLGFESETAPNGVLSQRHYLSVGGATLAVLVTRDALPALGAALAPSPLGSVSAVKLEYWHKDHLGSIVATSDHWGAATARYSYDPFGKRRTASGQYDPFGTLVYDWTSNTNQGTDRGYTGHEHLDDVGLVHMNGRIFDPVLGRFMQPDPFIQDPSVLQNYDRYTYCLNNPVTCTDPSGYLSFFGHKILPGLFNNRNIRVAAAIAVSIYLGPQAAAYFGSNIAGAAVAGFASGAISSGNLKGALQGAFTAAVFAGVGDYINNTGAFNDSAIKGARMAESGMGGIALHAVAGCVTSVAGGGKCGSGALSAAFSQAALDYKNAFGDAIGSRVVGGVVSSMVIGGTASVLGGGKFANGAQTAAMGYLFNYCYHSPECAITNKLQAAAEAVVDLFKSIPGRLAGWVRDNPGETALAVASVTPVGALPTRVVQVGGRAVEIASGVVSESQFLRTALDYLGTGYAEASTGRWLSADGLRQVRFGAHETRDAANLHGHFEAYDQAGGRVIENAAVKIVKDKP